MSESDRHDRRQVEPEIIEGADPEGSQGDFLERIDRAPLAKGSGVGEVLSQLLRSPRREAKKAREWADAARAHSELDEARIGLLRAREAVLDLPTILATDDAQRQMDLLQSENQLAEEERIAHHKALRDEREEEKLRAEIAEARRRRQQAENPPPPLDEDARRRREIARQFRERLGRRFTEQEIRAYATQRIAEIKQRAGGAITSSVQREIDNVTDVMNSLLDEL